MFPVWDSITIGDPAPERPTGYERKRRTYLRYVLACGAVGILIQFRARSYPPPLTPTYLTAQQAPLLRALLSAHLSSSKRC